MNRFVIGNSIEEVSEEYKQNFWECQSLTCHGTFLDKPLAIKTKDCIKIGKTGDILLAKSDGTLDILTVEQFSKLYRWC
jgi:hypothetical protein